MKKIINAAAVLSVAVWLWVIASWLNVISVNCNPAALPAAWNIFNLM